MFKDIKEQLNPARSLYTRISLTTSFVIIGLILQGVALLSDAWILLESFEHPHCRSNFRVIQFSSFSCNISYVNPKEIARAGPWRVCYSFPYIPNGHTDAYCADFADDIYTETWMLVLQLLCWLSPSLAVMGLLVLEGSALANIRRGPMPWAGSRFLILAGLCGIASVVIFDWNMTPAFLIYFDPQRMVVAKWWAFHFYLDGAILNFVTGLLWMPEGRGHTWGRKI